MTCVLTLCPLRGRIGAAVLAAAVLLSGAGSGWALPMPLEPVPDDLLGLNLDLKGALEAVRRGEYGAAIERAQKYAEAHPDSASAHEILGIAFAKQGELDKAVAHLLNAVKINPRQATAQTKLGDVLLAMKDLPNAKTRFLQAVAVDPADRLPHQRLGLIYEEEGELGLAVEHFEKGLVGAPAGYVGIKVNLGRLYNRARQFEKTVPLLRPVVTDAYRDATANMVLGTALLALKQTPAALECFERARKLEPKAEGAHLAMGIAYRDAGDLDKSMAELESALKARPDWSLTLYQMGETLAAKGRVKDAMERYAKAAAADDADKTAIRNRMAEVYDAANEHGEAASIYESLRAGGAADLRTFDGLASVLQATGRFVEAEKVLQEACAKYPADARPQYRLGLHYSLVREYDRGLSVLEKALTLSSSDPRIIKAISLTEFRRGNPDKAIATARKLLEVAPDSVEDRFYLATLLDEQKADDEAAQVYEQVLKQAPSHVATLNNLALLRLRQGQAEAAMDLARKALAKAPGNPILLDTYGWVALRKGDPKEARAWLEQAVAKASDKPEYRYHLAEAYRQLDLKREALEQIKKALQNKDAAFPERRDAEKLAAELGAVAP